MKKSLILLLALMLVLSMSFIGFGCQEEATTPETTAAGETAAATTAAEAEAETTAAPEEKKGMAIVRFLNQETLPAAVAVQRGWAEDFKVDNPNIDIIIEQAPANVINQTIATYVQAGAPLDIIGSDGGSAAKLAVDGLLEPLDDVIEALGGRDAFLRGRLLIYEDKVYAINQTATGPVMHYRKDIFEQLGLEPPTTWENILTAAKKISEEVDGMAGIAMPGGENRATTIMAGIYLWQNAGNFFNKDLEVTIDNPVTHEAMNFYAELLKYAPEEATGWSFFEPIESFFSGRSAMALYWHGLDLTYDNNPDLIDKVGVTIPEGRMKVTEQGGRYYVLFGGSENKEEAKKFLQHIFDAENAVKLTEVGPQFYVPATLAALEVLKSSEAPRMQAYGQWVLDVTIPGVTEFGYNQIMHPGGINADTLTLEDTNTINPYVSILWNSNLYARAIQQVAYGGVSAEDAAAECQKGMEDLIAEN